MSVLIVTSLGDIVIDLHTDRCPLTSKNFLKLCKIKYYNGCLFHTIQKDFTAQTGDPTGTGTGGDSIYKFLYGEQARFFSDEIHLDLKHAKMGTVAMASAGENLNASQFYFTLRDDLDYLDGKHTVFGEVAEGIETLTRINEAYLDEKGRPYKNIRIKHTYILDDPFDDPSQLTELIPDASPEGKPKDEVDDEVRLEDDWVPMDEQLDPAKLEEVIREKQAHSSAVVLESIGDIPEAEIKPPDNVLFVCKLNPVTEDEDLHTIFSRFGTVTSADIIRDYKTGDSLCYAFIEFEDKDACEQAYFKMDNALIDDRRIHVDFSQSVARLWSQFRRKDHQTGKGCFKCGALDHIAKDCAAASDKQPAPKYILKDGSGQHGVDNSRYEMIFDEDNASSPERGRKHRDHKSDDRIDKHKVRRQSSEEPRHRDHHRKDSSEYTRHGDRKREYKYNGQERERDARRGRDDDDENRRQARVREKYIEGKDKDRIAEQEHRKRAGPGSNQRGGRDEGDHKRRSSEDDRRRDDRGHRRPGTDDRDELRKKHSDDGTQNKEGREHRRESTETGNQGDHHHDRDRDHDRRHREDSDRDRRHREDRRR